nr:Ig-like domain-containing protein [uncultured Duganella sp.]
MIPLIWTDTRTFPSGTYLAAPDTLYTRPGGTGTLFKVPSTQYFALSSSSLPVVGGRFEYSTDNGNTWATVTATSSPSAVGAAPPNSLVRFVHTGSASSTADISAYVRTYINPADQDNTGFYSHNLTIKVDNAPTGINGNGGNIVSDAPSGGLLNTVTPIDTGGGENGKWVLESQSVSNLFAVSSGSGNVANITLNGSNMPPVDQQATVTVHYYDQFQTDITGTPIAGQGVTKTLTYTVLGASRDISFGNDITVNAASGNQSSASIATLSNGNIVVTWQSSTGGGVHAQILNSAGVAQGSELIIANGTESLPSVAALSGGRFIIAYGDSNGDIKFKIVAADGTIGAAQTVNAGSDWNLDAPVSIAVHANGSFQLTWGVNDYSTLNQATYNASGTLVTPASSYAAGYAGGTKVLSNDTLVAAAVDPNTYGFTVIINGAAVGSTIGDGYQPPSIAALSGDRFVVTWSTASGEHVQAQIFNSAGTAVSAIMQVETRSASGSDSLYNVQATALSDGSYVVTWESTMGDGSGTVIQGRRFDGSGAAIDATEFQVNQNRYGDQKSPSITALANGGFAVAWTDSFSGKTSGDDIELRIYTANLAPTLTDTNLYLTAVAAGAVAPSGAVGTQISSLVAVGGNVSDGDAGALTGIAISALDTSHGSWFYSLDNGAHWWAVSSVSDSNALLLAADSRLYFQPSGAYAGGTIASAVTFRAWDQTEGVTGGRLDASSHHGGADATSNFVETASLLVSAPNDTPVLATPTAITLTDTAAADTFSNTSGTLSASDADGIAAYGISGGANGSTNIGGIVYDVSKAGSYGTLYLVSSGPNQGKYVFVPSAAAVNALSSNTSETFTLTATDSNAAPATGNATLTINVNGANDTPVAALSIPSQLARPGSAYSYQFAANTFTDVDNGQTLSYSATLADGNALPSWLSFNAATRTFSGTPAGGDAALLAVKVTATDNGTGSLSASTQFDLLVNSGPSISSIVRVGSSTVATADSSVQYTVTFNEAVSGVDAGDFALTTTGSASGSIASISGSGSIYTITVSSLGGDGTLRLDLKTSGTGIQNGSNVSINGGYTSGASYTLDHSSPAAPSTPDLRSQDDSGASPTDNLTSVATPVFTGTAESGSTVTLYEGNTVLGSAVATGGSWSITSTTLSPGTHSLTVKASDAAGNVSAASQALSVTIDTSAPTGLALSSTGAATANAGAGASLATLTALDSSAVTYALATGSSGEDADNPSFTIAGNSLQVGGATLIAGTYHIYLSATDAAGNVSYLAQSFTVQNAPSVTSIVRAGGASASVGASATSASYTVTFSESVTGVDTSDFVLTASGNASGNIASISGSGSTYTVTVDSLGGDGTLRLDLKGSGTGIQGSGNTPIAGGYTSGATYTLDHTAPAAPSVPALRSQDDSGVSPSDNITSVTTPMFTGTAESGSTVTLYNGSTVLGTAVATGGTWSITSTTLPSGTHSLTVKATDTAGNVSAASPALSVTVDTSAPTSLALGSTSAATASAGSGASLTTLTALDSTAVTYALATGSSGNDADNASFTIAGNSLNVGAAALTAGTYHIYLSATDAAGNVSYLAQTITVQDAPTVTSIARAGGAGATVANGITSASYTVTFSESVTGVDVGDFVLTGSGSAGGSIASVSGSGTTYTVTVDNLSGDGTLRLDLKASGTGIQNGGSTAIAGGYTSGASYAFDRSPPAAPSLPVLRSLDDSGASPSDNITSVTTPVFSGTAESGSTVTLYNGSTVLGTAVATGGVWSITSAALPSGTHSLTVKATDTAGNVSAASPALSVTVDTSAPTGLALSSNTAAPASAAAGVSLATLTALDSTAVTYALASGSNGNDAHNASFTIVGNSLTVGATALTVGTYQIYLSATDAAGNVSYQAQTITVQNPPSVVSIVRAGDAGADVAASAGAVSYTVTFSESVSGVDAGDFVLSTTGSAGGSIASVSGSGASYTVTVNNLSGDGTLRLDLSGSGTGIQNGGSIAINGGYTGGASFTLDRVAPATPSAPVMRSADDSGLSSSDNITSVTTPVFTGTAENGTRVTLYSGATVLGSATASGGVWSIASTALSAGTHSLAVRATDAAGNVSPASAPLTVVIDTSAAAPAAPALAAGSDSGIVGDGITTINTPTITGSAEANARVTLYDSDGVTVLGTATANASGAWSIQSSVLAIGVHTLTVKQIDPAGNLSPVSAALALTIAPVPVVVDGVPVTQQPVTLPGGGSGTQVTVPIVTDTRGETDGNTSVADIPLVTSGGHQLLLAQLAPGFGLSSSGGASQTAGNSMETLIKSILAVTPGHAASDQSHLTGNGVVFLNQLASDVPLLVQTIVPTAGNSAPDGTLTLTGTSTTDQRTALVIDGSALPAGSKLALNSVDFAAIVGALNVTGHTQNQILTGDAAGQTFTVTAGGSSSVFSGGGSDTLLFAAPAATQGDSTARQGAPAGADTTVLHGGQGNDTVSFSGARADYNIEWHQGHAIVSAKAQPLQQALVINAETLAFSDQSVTVANSEQLTKIAGLYQDVLGRQADYKGVEFFALSELAGNSLGNIALSIITSVEAQARQAGLFNGNNAHDVELLYQRVFSRHSEADGLTFWKNAMDNGMTLAQVAEAFLQSPEMNAHQIAAQNWDFFVG